MNYDPSSFKVISFNANHTALNVKAILQNYTHADIIFIQEPQYSKIKRITSSTNPEGDWEYGTQIQPNEWILLEVLDRKKARVCAYVHTRWRSAVPRTRHNIISHPHLLCVSLLGPNRTNLLFLNVYNRPGSNEAVRHMQLLQNLPQFDAVLGDFNLHHSSWDSTRSSQSLATDLIHLMTEWNNQLVNAPDVHTHRPHQSSLQPSVIDLVWVSNDWAQHASTTLTVDQENSFGSDHYPLTLSIPAHPDRQQRPALSAKNRRKWEQDVAKLMSTLRSTPINDKDDMRRVASQLISGINSLFELHLHIPNIAGRSKLRWTTECTAAHKALQTTVRDGGDVQEARSTYRKTLKESIRKYYDTAIDQACAKKRPWDVAAWTKKRPPSSTSHIKGLSGESLSTFEELVQGCKSQFFTAADRQVDLSIIDEMKSSPRRAHSPFTRQELRECLQDTSNTSAPGPDRVSWAMLKSLCTDTECEDFLLNLYNSGTRVGAWPTELKSSDTAVTPKHNKTIHDTLKAHRPICLISVIGKLWEKLIANRIQTECKKFSLLHLSQCGGVRGHSTEDAGLILVHHLRQAKAKGLSSSSLAIDIDQFFPSVNHSVLLATMDRMGFPEEILTLMNDYVKDRTTHFKWSDRISDPVDCTVGVGQGSCLSPILSAIAIVPALCAINAKLPTNNADARTSQMLFVDDMALMVSTLSFGANNTVLKYLFPIVADSFKRIGITISADKLELAQFPAKSYSGSSPPLTITWNEAEFTVPLQKDAWRYLGFFLDPQLNFRRHVAFYATKALSTIRSYLGLGNSNRGLTPIMRRRLYLSCVIPLMTYGFRLWYTPRKPAIGLIAELTKAQAAASRWILGAFRTSPRGGMEMLAGILPIRLHLARLHKASLIRIHSLPPSHIVKYTMTPHLSHDPTYTTAYHVRSITSSNKYLPLHSLHSAVSALSLEPVSLPLDAPLPGQRITDLYSSRIILDTNHPPKASDEFDEWLSSFRRSLASTLSSGQPVGFTDGSAHTGPAGYKTATAYQIYRGSERTHTRTFCSSHALAINAEIIALGACIQHLVENHTGPVHTYTDSVSAIRLILDESPHTSHSVSILTTRKLGEWLRSNPANVLTMHWCPGHSDVRHNEDVDRAANNAIEKASWPVDYTPIRSLAWAKQTTVVETSAAWKRMASSRTYRGRYLIHGRRIQPTTKGGGRFLKEVEGNSLVARCARALLNHAPTGEYRQRFFPKLPYRCDTCGVTQSRYHILDRCPRYRHSRTSLLTYLRHSDHPERILAHFLSQFPLAFSFDHAPFDVG